MTLPPSPPPAAHSERGSHSGTGPALPANSFTKTHRQLATGSTFTGMHSGATPVKSQRFSAGLGNPPGSSQWRGGEPHRGVVKPERISAVQVLRKAASSRAAGSFTPRGCCGLSGCCALLSLRRPKKPSNACDRSGILKLTIP